jgi:hypothetical protein
MMLFIQSAAAATTCGSDDNGVGLTCPHRLVQLVY